MLGAAPHPLNEFIFKVQTRCNLNCSYCYVYNLADSSWRDQPASVSDAVAAQAAARIGEHAAAHGLEQVLVSLHGGEPLLRGIGPVRKFVQLMRTSLAPLVEPVFSMQTNATLVSAEIADELASLDVGVGVSLDGPPTANDRFRLDVQGRSSADAAEAGIAELRRSGALRGLLCVIDLRNDPVETFEYLRNTGAASLDFLLPHATWGTRAPGKEQAVLGDLTGHAPYGEWLTAVYDRWSQSPGDVGVRILEDLMHLVLGGCHTYEGIGVGPSTLVVVEADGSIELVDHLKSTFDGATHTGLDVFTNSFDEILEHPGVAGRQQGTSALHDVCRGCPRVKVCGGGLITHRWHPDLGFRAPTLYCSDMVVLIDHIETDLRGRIDAASQLTTR